METVYVCTGGCGGKVSEEEYNEGKKTCGTPGCLKYGQPFEPRYRCGECGTLLQEGEAHRHE